MIQYVLWAVSFITVWLSLVWIEFLLLGTEEQKTAKLPTVTIGIPAYNEEKGILRTLNSLMELDYPASKLQIIVVNDGSKDNTRKVTEKFIKTHPMVKLINKPNGGKASAVNAALDKAKGELFAVLDADSRVTPDSLRRVVSYISDKKTGAVITRMRVDSPSRMVEKTQKFEYIMSNLLRKIMSNAEILAITPGVLSTYRTEILRKVGGFCHDRDNLTEDLEIALRLKKYGYNIKMAEDAITYTKAPNTLHSLWKQRVRWYRGYIYNNIRYRDLFFSKEHGLFGVFYMPVNVLAIALLIINMTIIGSQIWKDVFNFIYRSLTIPDYLTSFFTELPTLKEFIIGRNLQITLPLILIVCIGIWMILKAHKMFKEKLLENIMAGLTYTFVLPYFTFANWLSALFSEIFKTKRKW